MGDHVKTRASIGLSSWRDRFDLFHNSSMTDDRKFRLVENSWLRLNQIMVRTRDVELSWPR